MTLDFAMKPKRFDAPIIDIGGDPSYASQVFDPAVRVNPRDATELELFASLMAAPVELGEQTIGRFTSTVADFEADPSDPDNWTFDGVILTKGSSGDDDGSDEGIRIDDLLHYGGVDYLFYTGLNAAGTTGVVCLATSSDGATWAKQGAVVTPGGQGRDDGNRVSQSSVIREGSTLTMLYSYRDGGTILPGIRCAQADVSDWTDWTKVGGGDVLTTAPSMYCEFKQLLYVNGQYVVMYEAGNASSILFALRGATAGVVTGPYTLLPWPDILGPRGSGWDTYHVATGRLFELNGVWYLFYVSTDDHDFPYGTNTYPLGVAVYPERAFGVATKR